MLLFERFAYTSGAPLNVPVCIDVVVNWNSAQSGVAVAVGVCVGVDVVVGVSVSVGVLVSDGVFDGTVLDGVGEGT